MGSPHQRSQNPILHKVKLATGISDLDVTVDVGYGPRAPATDCTRTPVHGEAPLSIVTAGLRLTLLRAAGRPWTRPESPRG